MRYRPEIDGLRAVAVLPVILYHAGLRSFEGGFVGVDVFFVISGYLITSILLRELEEGSFTILDFYERRARRILPALVVVVAACIPAALVIMTPAEKKDFAQSVLAVSVFLSNVHFWLESGYFQAASELKPLLHTWSLAVEEQFYIVFPIFLLLGFSHFRRSIFLVLCALALASLAFAEWGWRNGPSGNFFLAPGRAWELLAGALCAMATRTTSVKNNPWLSALGIAMIAASIALFDAATPFPSLYTLLPVGGTALVILFSGPSTIVGRILSTSFLVGLGLVSYSAYLWHQPLFAFARLEMRGEPPPLVYAGLIALTFALSVLSWRYVETPFRRKSGPHAISRRGIFLAAAIASAGMMAFGLVGHATDGWRESYLARLPASQQKLFVLVEQAQEEHVANARGRFDDGECVFDVNAIDAAMRARAKACAAAHGHGVLIFGDSHAIDLYGAVVEAELAGNPFIAAIVSGGCRPHTPGPGCPYEQIIELVTEEPDLFEIGIFTQAGFYLLQGHGYEAGERRMFSDLRPDERTPAYQPHREHLIATRDYLEHLADHLPVTWLTSRVEPHIYGGLIQQRGCANRYRLRPGLEAVFLELEAEIRALLAASEVKFLSQHRLLRLSLPEDLLSCDALFWSDGDHFSNAGEARFGKRMQVIENARATHGL